MWISEITLENIIFDFELEVIEYKLPCTLYSTLYFVRNSLMIHISN